MAQISGEEWDTGSKSALVSIGTHKLYLSVSGPDRGPGEPIVVLMPGLGSTIAEWVSIRRLVTPFARWLEYDRSGLGRSESPPEAPKAIHAAAVAEELDTLLHNAGVSPPYIVVCHSWGGLTSREFLHRRPNDVVGMVFVDANQEKTFAGYRWPIPYITAVHGDLDYVEVTGLAANHKLSEEEWAEVMKGQRDPRQQATEAAEMEGYHGDGVVLAAKKQLENCALGNRPICVIRANCTRDFQRLYDAGVAAGNGTEEERSLYKEFLETFDEKDKANQEEILKVSRFNRFVRTIDNGHNVQMSDPELVAEEVKWVWEKVIEQSA